jgi:hypothetical protein
VNWYNSEKKKCTGTVTKRGATMENVPVQFFIRYESIGYHNCFPVYEKNISLLLTFFSLKSIFSFFFFFSASLFAPLNGIQQLEDISDTSYQ